VKSGEKGTCPFTQTLSAARYAAIWFYPRIGSAQPAQHISGAASTVLKKPDTNDWLLVLMPD
jgi:Putative collagen-binding domain of a collagenase